MTSESTGFDHEASYHRFCGTYRRERVDRVTLLSPIPWQLYRDIDSVTFDDWRGEDRFRNVVKGVGSVLERGEISIAGFVELGPEA